MPLIAGPKGWFCPKRVVHFEVTTGGALWVTADKFPTYLPVALLPTTPESPLQLCGCSLHGCWLQIIRYPGHSHDSVSRLNGIRLRCRSTVHLPGLRHAELLPPAAGSAACFQPVFMTDSFHSVSFVGFVLGAPDGTDNTDDQQLPHGDPFTLSSISVSSALSAVFIVEFSILSLVGSC